MDVVLRHGVEYEATDSVALDDLIRSLEGNARLMKGAGELLTTLLPGLKIESKKISVVYLSQESPLKELLAYSVVLTYQDDLEKEVPQLIEQLTGYEIADQHDTLVTVIVMFIAIYGISKAFEILFPGRDKKALSDTEESLIQKLAAILGIAGDRIKEAAEILFTGRSRRTMIAASQGVFAPTRGQPKAEVRTAGGETIVPEEAVAEAQVASGLQIDEDDSEEFARTTELMTQVRVVLHMMDRDRQRLGWAGHIPSRFDQRVPMHLEKNLKPDQILAKVKSQVMCCLRSRKTRTAICNQRNFCLFTPTTEPY